MNNKKQTEQLYETIKEKLKERSSLLGFIRSFDGFQFKDNNIIPLTKNQEIIISSRKTEYHDYIQIKLSDKNKWNVLENYIFEDVNTEEEYLDLITELQKTLLGLSKFDH